jgi:hypothetical protein
MKVTAYNYNNSTAVPLHLSTDGANTIIGGNVGIGTASPNSKLSLIGNAAQDLNSLGFPKAMVYSDNNGNIYRCYNGTTGSSSGNCGFSVNNFTNGGYGINFGFPVANRFVSLAAGGTASFSGCNSSAKFGFPGPAFPNNINVYTFCTDEPESTVGGEFMIIVF